MNPQNPSDIFNVDPEITNKNNKHTSSSSLHKRPNKYLVLAYIIWLTIHIILFISEEGWEDLDPDHFYPWSKGLSYTYEYDIFEFIFYCGIPLLVYWVFRLIENKYYNQD